MSDGPSEQALKRHREACEAGELGYEDPETGLFVMTSVYLQDQGGCCGSGCRHCPWSEDEQRRAGRSEEAPCWPYPDSGETD